MVDVSFERFGDTTPRGIKSFITRFIIEQERKGTADPGLALITSGPAAGMFGVVLGVRLQEDVAYEKAGIEDRLLMLRKLQVARYDWGLENRLLVPWLHNYANEHGPAAAGAVAQLLHWWRYGVVGYDMHTFPEDFSGHIAVEDMATSYDETPSPTNSPHDLDDSDADADEAERRWRLNDAGAYCPDWRDDDWQHRCYAIEHGLKGSGLRHKEHRGLCGCTWHNGGYCPHCVRALDAGWARAAETGWERACLVPLAARNQLCVAAEAIAAAGTNKLEQHLLQQHLAARAEQAAERAQRTDESGAPRPALPVLPAPSLLRCAAVLPWQA